MKDKNKGKNRIVNIAENFHKIIVKYFSEEFYKEFSEYLQLCYNKKAQEDAHRKLDELFCIIKGWNKEKKISYAKELISLPFVQNISNKDCNEPYYNLVWNTILEWHLLEKDNYVPLKWLSSCSFDTKYDLEILRIDPYNQEVIEHLLKTKLDIMDHIFHHQYNSVILGDIDTAKTILREAKDLYKRLNQKYKKQSYINDIGFFVKTIGAWEAYNKTEQKIPFPEWRDKIKKFKL